MTLPCHWYECDTRCIAVHQQPASLIELCLSRGIDSHRLLRGTSLFLEDVAQATTQISPSQFLILIDNAQRLLAADDFPFDLGRSRLGREDRAAGERQQGG